MYKILLAVFAALIISNCSAPTNKNLKKNDDKQILAMIVVGKTTKDEVETMFGKPTEVDFDQSGKEKWTYAHNEASMNPMNYIPVTSILIGQDGKARRLVIVFDKNIVYKAATSTNNEKIKQGLLT